MSDRDDRPYYVGEIKKIVDTLDNEIDDSALIDQLEEYARCLRKFIEWRHSGLYIGVYEVGPDDNFTRCYKPLGTMTTAEASKRLDEIEEANGYYYRLREVTKEEWDDFIHLRYLTEIFERSEWLQRKYNDIPQNIIDDISSKISALREKLGLKYRWETVVY